MRMFMEVSSAGRTPGTPLSRAARQIFLLLLAVDAFFVVMHVLCIHFGVLSNYRWSLGADRGYSEKFQYLQYAAVCMGLAAIVVWRTRDWVLVAWFILIGLLMLDDMFTGHEILGLWISELAQLPAVLGMKPRHLGELLGAGLLGLVVVPLLLVAHLRARAPALRLSRDLFVLFGALVLCGVGIDLLHAMATGGPAKVLGILEDGGEILAVTAMIYVVLQHLWTEGEPAFRPSAGVVQWLSARWPRLIQP